MDEALTLTLPHEIIMHISACLLANHDMASSHSLSSTCREMNLVLLPINRLSVMQQHRTWEPQHLDIDVVLRYREMSAASTSDPGWRRSYGPPLNPTNGRSIWEVRIDRSRSNDGFMLMGAFSIATARASGAFAREMAACCGAAGIATGTSYAASHLQRGTQTAIRRVLPIRRLAR